MEHYLPHFKHDGEGVVAALPSSLFIINFVFVSVITFPSSINPPAIKLARDRLKPEIVRSGPQNK